jgi:predicted cobalt transporter CbtA
MKLLRVVPFFAAVTALMLGPVLLAFQADQTTGPPTKAETKARAKGMKAAEQSGEPAGKAGASSSKTAGANEATGTSVKNSSQATETRKARSAKTPAAGSAERTAPTVSESEISAAKASGKVWVNTETGVYHKGGQWYGATKQGRFMTEDEAVKAGYRASKSK